MLNTRALDTTSPGDAAAETARERAVLRRDVVCGLRQPKKSLPCKYFYDAIGAALFDRITTLDAYYPTRTELAIMHTAIHDIAKLFAADFRLVELGSGSGVKTRLLLDALPAAGTYVPVDISAVQLSANARDLSLRYPLLRVRPIAADYDADLQLPLVASPSRTVVYFPGSTVGNFEPADAGRFLARMHRLVGPGGGLVIGVDHKKDPAVLHRAYNDEDGVTAAFNLNLLARLNREADADFDLDSFAHYAYYEPRRGCIEMHLLSRRTQRVQVAGEAFALAEGESILTERSYKYTADEFSALLAGAGFTSAERFTDTRGWFSVYACSAG